MEILKIDEELRELWDTYYTTKEKGTVPMKKI